MIGIRWLSADGRVAAFGVVEGRGAAPANRLGLSGRGYSPGGVPPNYPILHTATSSNLPSLAMSHQRMSTYIDAYNVYHGLLEASLRSSRWLDLPELGSSLLEPDQQLVLTRY